jgi:hypothetical protein
MPPRRRTFYLADATILSNVKVRKLARVHPDRWLSAWGAFHVLIGVATLNGSPRLTRDDVLETIGPEHDDLLDLLRDAGLLSKTGIDAATFKEWCPKPRPRYPSDDTRSGGAGSDSGGMGSDSGGVRGDSAGVRHDSEGTPPESPTSATSSSSGSTTASSSSSRGAGKKDGPKDDNDGRSPAERLSDDFKAGKLTELDYQRLRRELVS